MTTRQDMIGYNRRVDYRWLEYTADLRLQGLSSEEIYVALKSLLINHLSVGSDAKRGSREKTITILMKTWVSVERQLLPLRDDALLLLRKLPTRDHKAIHWGMSMTAYPFWGAVAETTGRLLRLQGTASAAHVQRRIKERYGQRETAARSARVVLRAFIDWGVITEAKRRGVYVPGPIIKITNEELTAWLIEASLVANGKTSGSFKTIIQSPTLFPFKISVPKAVDLGKHKRLETFHLSLHDEMVSLREHKRGR